MSAFDHLWSWYLPGSHDLFAATLESSRMWDFVHEVEDVDYIDISSERITDPARLITDNSCNV